MIVNLTAGSGGYDVYRRRPVGWNSAEKLVSQVVGYTDDLPRLRCGSSLPPPPRSRCES